MKHQKQSSPYEVDPAIHFVWDEELEEDDNEIKTGSSFVAELIRVVCNSELHFMHCLLQRSRFRFSTT